MAKVQNQSTKNDPVIRSLPTACADEAAAVEFLEEQRWGGSPVCALCESGNVYMMKDSKTGKRQADYRWRCRDCGKQYTVRKGTVFEDSRIDLRHWCFAYWRAATSKKGVSALEIHRQTGVSYKSSLFMLHRIRFAMADSGPNVLGENGGDVEADETYVGGKPRYRGKNKRGRGTKKQCVAAVIERGGSVKTRPVADVTARTLKRFVRETVDHSARLITDENSAYTGLSAEYERGHVAVRHGRREFVRSDVHSNTIESFFAVVKRGLNGVYHSVSREHLHRYLSEFEFRHNHRSFSDGERTAALVQATQGKRLMYSVRKVEA
jgi:transposase-like protein